MKLFVCLTLALVATSIEGRGIGTKVKNVVKNQFIDTTVPDTETTLSEEDLKLGRELYAMKKASRKTRATEEEPFDTAPMENEGMFEGDIANMGLNSKTIYRFMGQLDPNEPQNANNMRNAIKSAYARWPGATIPYTISTQYSATAKAIMAEAMDQFAKVSCIKFVPRTNQVDYINILPDSGCYSYVGRVGGKQTVSLANGCIDRGIIMHELTHAVGFFHEQSRADRDQYVEVLFANIQAGYADQFDKYSLNTIDYLGQPYDYYSIMHYEPKAFSKNGLETIRPIASARAEGVTLKHRNEFSEIDIKELNIIANCPKGAGVTTAPSGTNAPATTTTKAPAATNPPTTTKEPSATNPPATTTAKAPVAICVDKVADCVRLANGGYCKQPLYVDLMTTQCPKSCRLC